MSKLIILEGNISAGKSTLTKKLAEILGYRIFLEPTLTNPYLEKFYKDPKKYALKMQLWLLRQRYLTYVAAIKMVIESGSGVILDRSVYSDWVFAIKNVQDGNISEQGFEYYSQLRNKMLGELPIPHITVYLDADPTECLRRLKIRSRDCESCIPIEYLSGLDECYKKFIDLMASKGSAVLRFDWNTFGNPLQVAHEIARTRVCSVDAWCSGNVPAILALVNNDERVRENMMLDFELEEAKDDSGVDIFNIFAENSADFSATSVSSTASSTTTTTSLMQQLPADQTSSGPAKVAANA